MNITHYLKAGQPGLIMQTAEIERAISQTKVECKFRKLSWDCHRGVIDPEAGEIVADYYTPVELTGWLSDQNNTVVFAQLLHRLLDVECLQAVLNGLGTWKATGCCLVLVGPDIEVPAEIEPFFMTVDFDLPDIDELISIQNDLIDGIESETGKRPDFDVSIEAAEAAKGLTEFEAETAFSLSTIESKCFDKVVVTEQKKQMIKKSGLMEFHPPVDESEVGGLKPMKQFFINRKKAYEPDSKLPRPKGALLIGLAGTGKSLTCKAVASIFGWPLIRLDISSLKGSLVGQSEQNVNRAIKTIEAFGRAVVWWDEIEKALSGAKASQHTGDTAGSMLGILLTWMQETKSEIFIMASANEIESLPSAFKRAGRFDKIFFVDLPNRFERLEIIDIMNKRYGSDVPRKMVDKLEGWTGAEIEQLAKDSLFDGIDQAYADIVPMSQSQKEEIKRLQDWAKLRAKRANDSEDTKTIKKVRRISQ